MEESKIVDTQELARWLKITPQTIRRYRAKLSNCPLLQGLPEPAMSRPRLAWWRADIEAWLNNKRQYRRHAQQ